MKIIKSLFLFLLFACTLHVSVFAQNKKPLFTLGEEKHYPEEFKYAYTKNNINQPIYKDSIKAYLDLYLNFRLKVKEAKELGYDTTQVFIEEFKLYKNQLEDSYLTPKKEKKALIEEAYERSKWEIRASHILIRLSKEARPKDTLVAYNKIIALRNRALGGENFADLAKNLSEDPSAKQNGGDLGYFSVFQMVYPFETSAYNTPIGEISLPIRTQFGYHFIKVEDKRPHSGKIKVAHIMIRSTTKNAVEVQEKAKRKIVKIDSLLQAGASWNELCKKYSEDQNSIAQNGELKPFGRGQIVPEFEKVAFKLKNTNDISAPVKTQFGWHIIKLVQKISIGSYQEEESKIARKIKSDGRSSMPRAEMLLTLKKENGFTRNDSLIERLQQLPASVVANNKWQFDSATLSNPTVLFTVGAIRVTASDFLKNTSSKPFDKRLAVKAQIKKLITAFEDSLIISYEKEQLPVKFPTYKFLVQEYYDGILLFSIMEDSIWNFSMKDSLGIENYYNTNKEVYSTVAIDTAIFSSNDRATLEKIKEAIPQELSTSDWRLLKSHLLEENNVSPLTLQIVSSPLEKKQYWKEAENRFTGELFEQEEQWYWIKITKFNTPLPLKEIKGKVIADYQQHLDTEWIKRLKKKYSIKINKKSLKKIYTHFEAID